jgi:hypothetical protein
MPHTEPRDVRQEQTRKDFLIYDAIIANFCAAFWELRGDTSRAQWCRQRRDKFLAEGTAIPPPTHTTI